MSDSFSNTKGSLADQDQTVLMQKYIQDGIDLIFRRKWLILLFVILGISVGGVMAWMKKDLYRSITVILVEQQKIHENYVPSVVGGSAAERVSTITQQVLSRTNLQKVIDEFHLFAEVIEAQGYEPVIDGLRKNVKIETKGRGGQLEAFTISFAHHDPMMAMKVTAKLASQYIDENIKIREQFIEGASEFLEQELAAAKKALDEKERMLSEYKLQYAGELPGQLETNLRTLDRFQEEKTQIQEAINGLNVRIGLLDKSIGDYESMAGSLMEFHNVPMQDLGGHGNANPIIARIAELKRELTKMSAEYTDAYPDVVSLKTQIRNLENELNAPRETPNISDTDDSANDVDLTGLDSPRFDPYLAELKESKGELRAQILRLKNRMTRVSKDMASLEGRIERTPTREQELLVLERDYGNMRENYQHLHEKRINARISENLDKRQKGERFRILDPANLPTKPEGLPRMLMVLAGFGIGLGLGGGLAVLLELLSPTFRRSDDAEVSLGLPMLATIPSFQIAYGKSMKLLPGGLDGPLMNNGQKNGIGSGGYYGVEGERRSLFYGKGHKTKEMPTQLDLVSKWRPESIVAEQYRVAATRLDLLGERPMGNVVLVTSAMKGEGKTSTSSNLAFTLARDLDEPTLIIDCDYKCPNLHNVFVLNHFPGVADYLAGEASLESCLQPVTGTSLWCMSVGDLEANPVGLSKFQHLSSLIEAVKDRFRFIILDGPPILPLADINLLSGMADILLMIVRSGATPKDVVQKATEMLQRSGPARLILTDAWSQGMPYYVKQGYSLPYSLSSNN